MLCKSNVLTSKKAWFSQSIFFWKILRNDLNFSNLREIICKKKWKNFFLKFSENSLPSFYHIRSVCAIACRQLLGSRHPSLLDGYQYLESYHFSFAEGSLKVAILKIVVSNNQVSSIRNYGREVLKSWSNWALQHKKVAPINLMEWVRGENEVKFWWSRGDIGVIMNAEKYYDYNYIRHLELGSYLFPMVLLSSFFFKKFQIKFIFKV